MGIITLARAQQNAALANVNTTELQDLIDAASAYIERYCDRKFTAGSTTEKIDGNDLDYIFVKNSYITALTSLTITESDGTETSVAPGNLGFDANRDNCRIWFDEDNGSAFWWFPKGYQNITVTYSYGYSTIPEDLQEACVQMVVNMYSMNSSASDPNLISESLGEYSYTKGSTLTDPTKKEGLLTPQIRQILDSYCRLIF
jgi:hypothetical protein